MTARQILLIAALTMMTTAPLAASHTAGELLSNGGFETDADGDAFPDDWFVPTSGPYAPNAPGCAFERSADAWRGNWSLSISADGYGNCYVLSKAFSAFAGRTYEYSALTKVAAENPYVMTKIKFFDANGDPISLSSSGVNPNDPDWAVSYGAAVAPVGSASARMIVYIATTDAGGEGLWDSASVWSP